MNDIIFIYYSLKSRWLNCSLSIFLTAFGVAIALLINQFEHTFSKRLSKDGSGIDLVIGAKGSPLQLILSTIYHVDIPPGNIPFNEAKKIINHPQIEYAIPLAVGDNWKGHRIVGTSLNYLEHYNSKLEEGSVWKNDFEVVVGSSVNLNLNQEFEGAHGLLEGGDFHGDRKYKVVGKIKQTGSVIDRLIITSVDSVLSIHGLDTLNKNDSHLKPIKHSDKDEDDKSHDKHSKNNHNHEHHQNGESHSKHSEEIDQHKHFGDKKKNNANLKDDDHDDHTEEHAHEHQNNPPEITAFLVTTKSPIANINLPRFVNKETSFQAANPAVEITRLTSMLGMGSKSFAILSIILILMAALSIFAGLAANLENRMGDLATLRALGYTKNRVFKIIIFEGMTIIVLGLILGLLFGITIFEIINNVIAPLNIIQENFNLTNNLIFIVVIVFIAGIAAALFPAIKASQISVANQLSRNI